VRPGVAIRPGSLIVGHGWPTVSGGVVVPPPPVVTLLATFPAAAPVWLNEIQTRGLRPRTLYST
jgi:hypothetical protein